MSEWARPPTLEAELANGRISRDEYDMVTSPEGRRSPARRVGRAGPGRVCARLPLRYVPWSPAIGARAGRSESLRGRSESLHGLSESLHPPDSPGGPAHQGPVPAASLLPASSTPSLGGPPLPLVTGPSLHRHERARARAPLGSCVRPHDFRPGPARPGRLARRRALRDRLGSGLEPVQLGDVGLDEWLEDQRRDADSDDSSESIGQPFGASPRGGSAAAAAAAVRVAAACAALLSLRVCSPITRSSSACACMRTCACACACVCACVYPSLRIPLPQLVSPALSQIHQGIRVIAVCPLQADCTWTGLHRTRAPPKEGWCSGVRGQGGGFRG